VDETILKPRPGRMGRNAAPVKKPDDDSDKTVISSHSKPITTLASSNISIFTNSILEAASDCFSLVVYINKTSDLVDVVSLKHKCVEAIKHFEMITRNKNTPTDVINNARYCLCALIDESVLNSDWSTMEWADESLLSIFHKETFGGEYFFTLLDNALNSPEQQSDFLELQYHCLNFGFKGKYRLENSGDSKVEDYRNRLYQILTQIKGPVGNILSPNWQNRVAAGVELRNQIPLWVVFSILGLVALLIYLFINMQLNSKLTSTEDNLASIHPITVETISHKDEQLLVLEQILQTEIQMGLVSLILKSDRIRITIHNKSLFNPGDAHLLSSFQPILEKLALSLEGTKGKILITGHTDNSPISTEKYPTNWHLSLARATQVANSMAKSTNLSGRLWPEGKGAAESIVDNSDPSSRSLNRRIEIDLLF